VDTLEERYNEALATKETLEQKVLEGVSIMDSLLTDFEARAYAMKDSGLGKSAYGLLEDGRRRVDEGFGRAKEAVDEGMDMARRAAGSIELAVERALERARENGLIKYHDLPVPWRVNEHITSGYRFHASKIECVKSALSISNEMFNIWSHAIGLIIVLSIAFYFYPSTVHFRLSTKSDIFIAGVFFFAACKCLICSTMWHTFNSIAEKDLMERFACVDYTGISLLVAASIMTTEYTAFYCEPGSRWFWMITTGTLGIGGTILPWHPTFNRADMSWARVVFYVALALTGGFPVIQLSLTRGADWAMYFYTPLLRSVLVYLGGAILYACKVPERWCPGMFDYVGGSHNIWHLAVLGGILFHYHAMKSFFENAFTRAMVQCTTY
jgi:adiponectin receptor